jgi:predicted Rossmann fold flavoprotein
METVSIAYLMGPVAAPRNLSANPVRILPANCWGVMKLKLCAMQIHTDVLIVGAGAAGLHCAAMAGQRGLKVLLIDHSEKIAEKLRISGGGRCNFTNRDLDVRAPQKHFISANPHFCRSALSRYTPQDFIDLIDRHGIAWHEKHKGQLFCNESSEQIIRMLLSECEDGHVTRWHACKVQSVTFLGSVESGRDNSQPRYQVITSRGLVQTRNLVIATGGLSIPAIGATGWGYEVAQQFGLRLVSTRPALVPLTFSGDTWHPHAGLAGLSLPVEVSAGTKKQAVHFQEDLLFTHKGLSGPACLQISSYWQEGQPLCINLLPGKDLSGLLSAAKRTSRKTLANELALHFPSRLAESWISKSPAWQKAINQVPDMALHDLAQALSQWHITPSGTEGYKKAEVTVGGVDTRDLSSQTMESRQKGLFFVGEVVDVTGWLGGYNFQWAWASAHACAQALV